MESEQTPEREQRMWLRIRPSKGAPQPDVMVSTVTPFPFWLIITSIVVFIPLALIVAFFVKRQMVVVSGDALMVLEISFWRYNVVGELVADQLGEKPIGLDGKVLIVDGERLHLEPGWLPSAEKLIELNRAAGAPA